MRRDPYLQALLDRKPVAAVPEGMTREYAERAIESLTAELKGPLSNVERVALIHERQNFRDVLALMDAGHQLDSGATRTSSPEGASTP